MKIAYFKTRCFVCWKGFEIIQLPDSAYGEYLFIDYKTRVFRYFNWIGNGEIENVIKLVLSDNEQLQFENDNTKGNTAIRLVGLLADCNFEPIFGYVKCPRCSTRFHSISNNKTRIGEINELTFEKVSLFSESDKVEYLKNEIKTRYNTRYKKLPV